MQVFVLALLFAAVNVHAQVNSLPAQPHLLVKGQAERVVVPDRFKVSLALQRVDTSPEQARKLAQVDAGKILEAFKVHHALKGTVEASTLSIQPQYVYESNKQVFKGTQVSRTLSATFEDLADVRGLLATITTNESVLLTGISTEYADEAALRAQLKREAAAQSRDSAEGLAKAYGTRITGLYTISDVAPSFAYGVQAGTWPGNRNQHLPPPPPAPDVGIDMPRAADVYRAAESLEAGTITISENVYAVFLIEQ
jgi:uncharacterized protein YggE